MRLEQALFGYKGGHRRISSSISFQPGDERFLVRMTDLSGSRSVPGFENYVSGYALPSKSGYVFAKTWNAPECERPGCVWTHVILIGSGDWRGLTPAGISESFHRPAAEKLGFDSYSNCLVVGTEPGDERLPKLEMRENIVRALYSDDRPIIISESEERTQLSLFLMSLVMQRPLATRLSLSFCTGALSYLEANSVPIRIQAMPSRIARMVRDEVHLLHGEEEPLVSEWTKWLVKDLKRKDIVLEELFAPFDNTSQTYEEPESVAIIRKLSEARVLFQCAHDGSQTAEDVLRGVTTLFPDGETQVPFKNALVGELAKTSSQRSSLVRVLFDSEEIAFALQESKSSLFSVALLLAKQDPTLTLNLLNDVLFQPYKNKVQQDLVHFLLSEIQLLAAEPTRPLETQVLFAIAREQKELISRPGFWLLQRSFDESIELAETLAEDLDDELVLAGLLAAGRFDLLVRILRMRGAQGAREALNLARSLKLNDSSEYQKVLALRGEVLDFAQTLAWGEAYSMRPLNEAQLFILASSSVEPHRLVALAPDISIWLNALSALPSEPQRMFAIAVFLACGEEFVDGWRLLRKSFDVIHQSTGWKTIPSEWWGLVKSRLPTLAVWEKWDKCERLRRGAVDSILRAGLPESMVEQVSQDRTLQQRLREIYRNRR